MYKPDGISQLQLRLGVLILGVAPANTSSICTHLDPPGCRLAIPLIILHQRRARFANFYPLLQRLGGNRSEDAGLVAHRSPLWAIASNASGDGLKPLPRLLLRV